MPSVRWILDDGPFDALAGLVKPPNLARYPSGRLVVAPATAQEAHRSDRRVELLGVVAEDDGQLFEVFDLLVGDRAWDIFLELHGEEKTSTDRAERESIAWALVHADDAVLVLEDQRAAVTALAELGLGRVAHPFDLWIELLEAGAVTDGEFRRLCDRTKGKDGGLIRMPWRVERRFPRT